MSNLNRQPHGHLVHCPGGYRAYVPSPPPPPLNWNDGLTVTLSSADRAIGRLAGEGRRLPNPHLLIRPFVRKEAVLSSRIEGTQATLGELLAAEAGAAVERSPDDLREVGNYVAALEYGLKRLETLPISLRLVRELHDILMRDVRGNMAAPGEFRQSQNWIGPPGAPIEDATYVPPPPSELMTCLNDWEGFLYDETLPPLVHAAVAHAQFESIHPFVDGNGRVVDGNGRVGRLLITLMLVARGVIPSAVLYLSAYFEAYRAEYYSRLQLITERGEWEEWLTYFLRGVALQSDDAVDRIQRLDRLLLLWRRQMTGSRSMLSERAIDLFAENPFWTVRGLAGRLGVAFTTAQRAINRLADAGVVERVGEARRNRVYCARAILEVLEEPPRQAG